jgi:GTP cyclohydrolase I
MKLEKIITDSVDQPGDDHFSSSAITPLKANAFEKTDAEKIQLIQKHFEAILDTLGMDLTDDSLSGTPLRVAKMYVKEIFGGLHPDKKTIGLNL